MKCKLMLCVLVLVHSYASAELPSSGKTLKQAYQHAFLMGAAVNDDIVSGKDKQSQQIVLQHFNTLTLENAMKAEVIRSEKQDVYYWPYAGVA